MSWIKYKETSIQNEGTKPRCCVQPRVHYWKVNSVHCFPLGMYSSSKFVTTLRESKLIITSIKTFWPPVSYYFSKTSSLAPHLSVNSNMDESARLCVWTPQAQVSHQTLPVHQNGATTRQGYRVRRIGSNGAVLLIVWTFIVFSCGINPVYLYASQAWADKGMVMACFYVFSALILLGPTVGLLASIRFGRYSTLNTGLWLMWAGSVGTCCALVIQQWFTSEAQQGLFSGFMISTTVTSSVGLALFTVNAVPFGLDQMPDASEEQITAFIFWYTWSFLAGIATILALSFASAFCQQLNRSGVVLVLSLLVVVLLSFTLCSGFLLHGWLIIEPKGINPLKTFCGVLRFAAKHKTPVRRSAFTYWEEVKPSRLDLAKTKYGGPYTHEEVEDVKTCLRMVVVIVSISVTMSVFSCYLMSSFDVLEAEFIIPNSPVCNLHNLLNSTGVLAVTLVSPLYEVFLRPLIKKRIPGTLRKVGLSQSLSITASLLLLVSTTVWYIYTNPNVCMFSSAAEGSSPFQVDSIWIEVPTNILALSFIFLAHTAMLEFVCAQAPYILRGLLVGLGYSVVLCSFVLGIGVYFTWKVLYQEKAPNSPSCGVWFYLFTTITATLGCVLWCAVAKWYKRRERDEPDMCRIFAENYYDH